MLSPDEVWYLLIATSFNKIKLHNELDDKTLLTKRLQNYKLKKVFCKLEIMMKMKLHWNPKKVPTTSVLMNTGLAVMNMYYIILKIKVWLSRSKNEMKKWLDGYRTDC